MEDQCVNTFNLVKGAMQDVIRKEVMFALNFICPRPLGRYNEHICMREEMKDITFCYAGLIQKYDTAYNIIRLEMGDADMKDLFIESIFTELRNRGLSDDRAKLFTSLNVISTFMEHIETYAKIFERIRETLLVRALNNPAPGEDQGKCLNCNFAILNI